MSAQPKAEQAVSDPLANCTSCGACQKVCPFLQTYGLPKELLAEPDEKLFFCANCSACSRVCPEKLPVAESIFQKKRTTLAEEVPWFYAQAKAYADRGHRFPFSHWEKAETVFWPGCSFSGSAPKLVLKVRDTLDQIFKQRVGLVLDCCYDPCYQLGSVGEVKRAFEEIKRNLEARKIKRVILGCTNCYKNFKNNLSEELSEVKHVLEIISGNNLKIPFKEAYLHHPCPAWRFDELRSRVKAQIQGVNLKEANLPACCGAGGALHLDEKLAQSFREKTIKRAQGKVILTYCMGCKGRFLKGGAEAYHLLEFLPGFVPKRRALGSTQKWLNRFFLSLKLKLLHPKSFLFLSYLLVVFAFYLISQILHLDLSKFFEFIKKMKDHPLTFLFYLSFYTVAPSLFISSLALTMIAGFLWGPFLGTLMAVTGATLGASLSFLLARYFFYDSVKKKFGKVYWQRIWQRIERDGWKFVAFLRLFPLFPFPIINFLLGITPIKFWSYALTSFFFMLPAGFIYTFLGYSLVEVLKKNPLYLLLALSLLILFSLLIKRMDRFFKGEKGQPQS